MTRRGFGFWPVQLFADGEIEREEDIMVLPSLRNAWGALLLSFALLSGSVVLVFSYLLQG